MADETSTEVTDELPPEGVSPGAETEELDFDLEGVGADEPSLVRPSLASLLRDQGFELSDDASDDDVVSRMEELEDAAEERDRLRQENQRYQAWIAQQQQAGQQQAQREERAAPRQPEQPEAASPAAKTREEPPEWQDHWESYLEYKNGALVIKEEHRGAVDSSLPEKYLRRKQWERERLNSILSRYDELVDESRFDKKLEEVSEAAYRRAVEEIRAEQQQRQVQTEIEKFDEANAGWLYSSPGVFTEAGQLFNDRLVELINMGHTPAQALHYAKADVQSATGQAPWAEQQQAAGEQQAAEAEPPAQPTPSQKRVALRRKRNNGVNRIAQAPVQRREGAVESAATATSIKQLASNQWMQELMQGTGEAE